MSTNPLSSHKVPRIMRAKAKKTPMCSASLIAIKLKGLAAPGEALKNKCRHTLRAPGQRDVSYIVTCTAPVTVSHLLLIVQHPVLSRLS